MYFMVSSNMRRFCLRSALAITLGGFFVASTVSAQTAVDIPEKSVAKQVQVGNRVAMFTVSFSSDNAALDEEVTLAIRVRIARGWHIGPTSTGSDSIGFPTEIEFEPLGLKALGDGFNSSVKPRELELAVGKQEYMQGEFSWTRKYRVTVADGQYGGIGKVRYQACDDKKCLPPESIKFTLGAPLSEKPSETSGASMASTRKEKSPVSKEKVIAEHVAGEKAIGEPIVLQLEPSELKRTRPQIGNIVSLLIVGRATEKMVWKGTIPSGPDEGVGLYLPKSSAYSLVNTGSTGTVVSNTATYASVDQDGDGVLAEWEAVGLERPIRIRDNMYRVKEIDIESKTLTLQQLDMPLRGSLVGYRCPDFVLSTFDGKVVSNKSILGKATVLDIWAVTCHNCYEGFPKIAKSLEKHGTEKLQVILMTVDTSKEFYDSQAPRLFETYGGGEWPQLMLPGGFDGALVFGDYGFGSVVVDEKGIVRAVGVHSFEIESVIDRVIAGKAASAGK
jgi:thiol:disulfide interchange protein DsbD